MSQLAELVEELCPDGVNYTFLGDILEYEQPTKYLVSKTNYNDRHATPVLTAGKTFILGRTDETTGIYPASTKNPVLIFDDFTTAFHWVDFPFKAKSSAMKILKPTNGVSIDFRYVYHAMRCVNFQPSEHARHWISQYSQFRIPMPPLAVQRAIVRILDEFAALEEELKAELKAELDARKKQCGYYRDSLLTFDSSEERVRWVELSEVSAYSTGRIASAFINDENFVGVDNLLSDKRGKTTASYSPNTSVITSYGIGDVLLGNIRPYLKKIWIADRIGGCSGDVLAIKILDSAKTDLSPRFLFHVLSSDSFFTYNNQNAKGAKMPRGDKSAILRYGFFLPSLDEQERVVKILDDLDLQLNDLSIELPAEIDARRKQYEYYREQLLTFKELAS
jgi:type I restriction enzyme S subunit